MSALVQIYSYSRCSTCRKALSWLEAHNIDYKLIDIVRALEIVHNDVVGFVKSIQERCRP